MLTRRTVLEPALAAGADAAGRHYAPVPLRRAFARSRG